MKRKRNGLRVYPVPETPEIIKQTIETLKNKLLSEGFENPKGVRGIMSIFQDDEKEG